MNSVEAPQGDTGLKSAIRPFEEAFRSRSERLAALNAEGRRMLGYFCTYTPLEVIHAAGLIPIRVLGGEGTIGAADTLAPGFICPYMRRALEAGLAGRYDGLRGMVMGYTCDVACGVINIWAGNIGGDFFHTLPLPYNDTPASRAFLRAALDELVRGLETVGDGKVRDRLPAAIDLYAEISGLLARLSRCRFKGSFLSAGDFLSVIQAGFTLPPEEYLAMCRRLVDECPAGVDPVRTGLPVLVSGSLVEDPKMLEVIDSSGGMIVADDLCTGLRFFESPVLPGRDPFERLIERHFRRWPCPARARAVDRVPRIVELARHSGAKGVVFLLQKFCTPHLADQPILIAELQKAGLPSITLEMDEAGLMEGRLRTHLESFFEILGE